MDYHRKLKEQVYAYKGSVNYKRRIGKNINKASTEKLEAFLKNEGIEIEKQDKQKPIKRKKVIKFNRKTNLLNQIKEEGFTNKEIRDSLGKSVRDATGDDLQNLIDEIRMNKIKVVEVEKPDKGFLKSINKLVKNLNQIADPVDKLSYLFNNDFKQFIESLDGDLSDNEKKYLKKIKDIVLDIVSDKFYLFTTIYSDGEVNNENVEEKIITLYNAVVQDIFDLLIKIDTEVAINLLETEEKTDTEFVYIVRKKHIEEFVIESIVPKLTQDKFFDYYCSLKEYDLSELQIYNGKEDMAEKYNYEHCVINSFKVLGMGESDLRKIKDYYGENMLKTHIPKKSLDKIAEMLDICIIIKPYCDREDKKCVRKKVMKKNAEEKVEEEEVVYVHGENKRKVYNFMSYRNHMMPIIRMNYGTYSIKHYEEVCGENDFTRINKIKERRKNGTIKYGRMREVDRTCSINIIRALAESDRFYYDSSISEFMNIGEDKDKSKILLDNINNEQFFDSYNCGKIFKPFYIRITELIENNETGSEEYMNLLNAVEELKSIKDYNRQKEFVDNFFERDIKITNLNNIIIADTECLVQGTHKAFQYGVRQFGNDKNENIKVDNFKDFLNLLCFGCYSENEINDIEYINRRIFKCKNDKLKKKLIKDREEIISLSELKLDLNDKKRIVFFHNLRYDFNVIKKEVDMNYRDVCIRSNNMYNATITYKGIEIEFRDSYKYIPKSLGDFKDMFKLDVGKMEEFNVYKLYTEENIQQEGGIPKFINGEENPEFFKFKANVKKEIFDLYYRRGFFNHLKFYEDYLKLDCETLEKGLRKAYEMLMDITSLCLFDFLTISALGFAYMVISNACLGLCSIKGHLRSFIMESIVGGRVCLRENEMIETEYGVEIVDFDAVSLYPASMRRSRLPKGKCKLIPNDELKYEEVEKYDHYVIECSFDIKRKRQLPGFSYKSKDGKRNWVNEFPKGQTVIIDKIALNDLKFYHEIENIQIFRGVYWNEGFNDNVQIMIQRLFDERAKAKDEDNDSLSEVLKLLMNSIYGKSLLKPSDTKNVIKSNLEFYTYGKNEGKANKNYFKRYIENHYFTIKDIDVLNEKSVLIKEKEIIYEHSNLAHIGGIILSNSKKIMHEVFKIADDNNMDLYYTDTDAITMKKKDSELLAELFEKAYGRELVGENL